MNNMSSFYCKKISYTNIISNLIIGIVPFGKNQHQIMEYSGLTTPASTKAQNDYCFFMDTILFQMPLIKVNSLKIFTLHFLLDMIVGLLFELIIQKKNGVYNYYSTFKTPTNPHLGYCFIIRVKIEGSNLNL